MPRDRSARERRAAIAEQAARERGRAVPHYMAKLAKKMLLPKKPRHQGKTAPQDD